MSRTAQAPRKWWQFWRRRLPKVAPHVPLYPRWPSAPVEVWKCLRCEQEVDMAAFRCGCEKGPSPWEPQ